MNARPSLRAARSLVSSTSSAAAPTASTSTRAAARAVHSTAATPSPQAEASSSAASTSHAKTLVSSLILSRPPTILRQPTKLEAAYFQYNRQLSEALQQPFSKDFYFKKGSAAEKRFEEDQANATHGFDDPSKSKGKKASKKAEASDDGSDAGSAMTAMEGDAESQPLPRETEADLKNDLQSLQRKLDRTLYLVVKGSKAGWSFPKKVLDRKAKENLHVAAPLAVTQALGKNLDIWLTTNSPIALHESGTNEKTYFMHGRIIAGQPQLGSEEAGAGVEKVSEYRWLTREEVQQLLVEQEADGKYWTAVEDLLDA